VTILVSLDANSPAETLAFLVSTMIAQGLSCLRLLTFLVLMV
jgi:hypothetical protein